MADFDKKAFLTMIIAIVTIVGIIAVFSLKSDKQIITPAPQIREGLRDIVN
ncbi:unknown [Clostridium sp. CAG:306]|nr:unknown [Clostridium sp. CAG:306]